ncbi:hypothetical protein AAIH18_22540, partial [Pantoea agglomerans]|uniref:hypothetical protein n=1 Tax=Enterobacter agglomerans TaxID=549 RepID=UPI003D2E6B8F
SKPGGVDVVTRPGGLTSRSDRSAAFYAAALLIVGATIALTAVLALMQTGLREVVEARFILIIPAIAVGQAIWSLIAVARSVDVNMGLAGIEIRAPFRRPRFYGWDQLVLFQRNRRRLVLFVSTSKRPVTLIIRHQQSDHTVLRALIDRCAEFPAARERIGDMILGDLLVDGHPTAHSPAGHRRLESEMTMSIL